MVKLKTLLPLAFFVWIQMPLYFLYSQEQFEYITIMIGFPTNLAMTLLWWSILPLLAADPIFHVVTWIAPLIQLYVFGLIIDWIISKVKRKAIKTSQNQPGDPNTLIKDTSPTIKTTKEPPQE